MEDSRHKEFLPIAARYLGIDIIYDEDCDCWRLPDDAEEYSLIGAKIKIDSLIKDERYDKLLPIRSYITPTNMTGDPTLVEIIEVKKGWRLYFP